MVDQKIGFAPLGARGPRLVTTLVLGAIACVLVGAPVLAATTARSATDAPASATTGNRGVATSGTVDLASTQVSTRLTGAAAGPGASTKSPIVSYDGKRPAALLGDVNGDAIGDMAIGDPNADPRGRANAGSVYVVFGRHGDAPALNVAELGDRGYRIDGRGSGTRLGASIAALGDGNNDKLADFAIGAPGAAAPGRAGVGVVFVLRGDKGPVRNIDLGDKEPTIVRLLGAATGDQTGWALAALPQPGGDPDGLVIGAPTFDPAGLPAAGAVYVVPRIPRTGSHELGAAPAAYSLAPTGYRIEGDEANSRAGTAVGSIADLSGDGRHEVLIGAPLSGPNGAGGNAGAAYAVASRPIDAGASVSLDDPELDRIGLQGDDGMRLGESVLGLGDLDGDGVPDFAVGAPSDSPNDRAFAGSVLIVAGESLPTPTEGESTTALTVSIAGAQPGDRFGSALALAGDLDGDVVPDLLVAARKADALGRQDAGAVYALRGRDIRSGVTDMALLGHRGVRLAGAAAGELAGSALAAGPDAGGGTRPDVLVGGSTTFALLDLPTIADEPAIAAPNVAGCAATSGNIELVVDDTESMGEADPARLRRSAIEQMLTQPRGGPLRLGAIEISDDVAEVFAPLTIHAAGLGGAPDAPLLEGLRALLDERIRNDGGSTDYSGGLLAAVQHHPTAGALVLITDATEDPAPLEDPGRPVYVLELPGPYLNPSAPGLKALAKATGGRYFEATDAESKADAEARVSLPAALAIVEADLRCEETLTTKAVKTGADEVDVEDPSGTTPEDTDDAIATAPATPEKPATFVTGVPAATKAVTMTLTYSQGVASAKRRASRKRAVRCIDRAPVSLGRVRVRRTGSGSVIASSSQLRRALSGRLAQIGPSDGAVKLYARGSCGPGYLTLRITGIDRVGATRAEAQAAVPSPTSMQFSARMKHGKKPRRMSTAVNSEKKR